MAVQLIKNVLGDVGGALLEHFYALTRHYGQVILSQKMAFVVFPLEAQKMLFCGHRLGSQWFNEFEPLT